MNHPDADLLADRFVESYADAILRLCVAHALTREDAQDICQNVFVKLLQRAPEFRSAEHEKAWVLRVAVNESKNLLKSAPHRLALPLDEARDKAAPAGDHEDLLRAVQALPRKYREAVHLYYFEGYHAEEIAHIVGATPAAVRQRLSRARRLLRDELEQEDRYEQPIY